MNHDIQAAWIGRLESGAVPQATSQLRDRTGGGRCCLGVLCDLAEAAGIGRWEWKVKDGFERWVFTCVPPGELPDEDDESWSELPRPVQEWAWLTSSNPQTGIKDQTVNGNPYLSLAELNDEGWTFADIAERVRTDL